MASRARSAGECLSIEWPLVIELLLLGTCMVGAGGGQLKRAFALLMYGPAAYMFYEALKP